MAAALSFSTMIDTSIFEKLQVKIDEDSTVREKIRDAVQNLERQERVTMSVLSQAHSTAAAQLPQVVDGANSSIFQLIDTVTNLKDAATGSPYYKYNSMWTREMQNAALAIILHHWLESGKLFTVEQVGEILNVPVNLKDEDAFHLSIEEYLHALISLIEELARLAVNSVTLGDYSRPLQISKFVKDLHAGFQILNLKNDSLRKRSDSIKYNVKNIEDVVYDLSLRNLVPRGPGTS